MLRFPLMVFILMIAAACVHGEGVALLSLDATPDAAGPNLVPNGGFEIARPGGIPDGWKWDSGGTTAMCVVDRSSAAEGRQCVKITSRTPSTPGVYAELTITCPTAIEPGKQYTLSGWTKSDNPGYARLGGGGSWLNRITLPATGGKWQRVAVTFTANEADRKFEIALVLKDVTRGLWLDDVRLEQGSRATLAQSSSAVRLCPETPEQEVLSEGEFSSAFLVSVPRALSGTLEATVSGVKSKVSRKMDLAPGVMQVVVKGISEAAGYAPRTLTLRLTEGGKELAFAQTSLRFYSVKHTQTRLDEMEKRLPMVRAKLDRLKASGQDTSYPLVSYTVLENFIGYAREDASEGEIKRAVQQLSDLESMEKSLSREIAGAASGKAKLPAVPRWTGDARPVVKSSSFISTTTTPGKPGVETRPVFFTGYGHFSQVRKDLEKFPSYGANIIQIEVGPWAIFPKEDVVEGKPVQDLLTLLDRAKAAGVAVNLLLSPHYMPDWLMKKHPELRKKREYFVPYCVHASETRELLKRFISVLVPPIKDHPALHSICISNEPRNAEEPCEPGARDWHNWLKVRHGDIATLNSRWETSYASIDEIALPDPFKDETRTPIGRWGDYVRWNQEVHAGWHRMLADAVRAAAPGLPVHAKIQSSTLSNWAEVKLGNDPYLMGQVCDINGNDGVNLYTHGEDLFAETWAANGVGYDLQRSTRDAPVFNSENHIIMDREMRYIPGEHVYCALWQQAILGQSATTIWVWERSFDKSHDFAGSIMHRPACARAVGIVNHDLNRAANEVTALQQAPAQALILHNTSAMVRDGDAYGRSMLRLYLSLALCGVKVGFVTERQLESGLVPGAPVVCVPIARHLSNAAFNTLRRYKGHVLALASDILTHDEFGKARSERISAEAVPYDPNDTGLRELSASLTAKLASWGVRPPVEAVGKDGKPAWGVHWRTAETADGIVVNLCNYLNAPVSLKLSRDGKAVVATDVLSGEVVKGPIALQPLDVKLLRVK